MRKVPFLSNHERGWSTVILYFAGNLNQIQRNVRDEVGMKNFLISFYNTNNLDDYPEDINIFMDSGGFTFRIRGSSKNIQEYLKEYINFLKENEKRITCYANLDTKSVEESRVNQKKMEAEGLLPIPVYHFSEFNSIKYREWIKDLCSSYKYVALGGTAGNKLNRKQLYSYFSYCFNIAEEHKTKIHGFGITATHLMKSFPFYSVDSSSWLMGERRHVWYLFDRGTLKVINIPKKIERGSGKYRKITLWNSVQWKKFADYMEEYKHGV